MSFWKKILGQEDLPPEEKERLEKEKAEKKAQKEAQKQLELKHIEKFFGPDPGFTAKANYSVYKKTLMYIEDHVLTPGEKVLATIPAEYDKTKKREIKGVLVATDQKLIFGIIAANREYVETFDYRKMVGISLAQDGLLSKELHINFSRGSKKFDDIVDDALFKRFLSQVREQIAIAKSKSTTVTNKQTTSKQQDKYKQLEQLGKLKEQGILTEEEFQAEKRKILES